MRNTSYHQYANAITGKVFEEIRAENIQLLDEVKSAEVNILRAMHTTINQENIDPQETQNTNSTIEGTMHQVMMKTLQVMQREILGLEVQMNNNVNDAMLNTSNKRNRGK